MRPNPPRMVTVIIALLLTAAGLALLFMPGNQIADIIRALPLGADLTRQIIDLAAQQTVAWLLLAISPILLIAGSLVRGL